MAFDSTTVTKEIIRQYVWDYLETKDLAAFPRPVHHRIPNFKGAEAASDKVKDLIEFQNAQVVKVNPDSPQKYIRFLTLEAQKTLLVPTPRLKSGLFNRIVPPLPGTKQQLRICSSHEGVRNHSVPVGLDSKVKIDLVIIGSVAVSKAGYRIGKGEGFADIEFAMMSTMGAVNSSTVVISTVHDCQVFESLPERLFGQHDVPVDIIVTPTRVIRCEPRLLRPPGIIWSILSDCKIKEIPILRKLQSIEKNKS